jgi:hypothetical protein
LRKSRKSFATANAHARVERANGRVAPIAGRPRAQLLGLGRGGRTRAGGERWVSASGQVEILRDGEAQSINARIRRRYLAPKALDSPIEAALAAPDDVTLRLAPTAWRSWAAPKIGESTERAFLAVDA